MESGTGGKPHALDLPSIRLSFTRFLLNLRQLATPSARTSESLGGLSQFSMPVNFRVPSDLVGNFDQPLHIQLTDDGRAADDAHVRMVSVSAGGVRCC